MTIRSFMNFVPVFNQGDLADISFKHSEALYKAQWMVRLYKDMYVASWNPEEKNKAAGERGP